LPALLVRHVTVIEPCDWMLGELGMHEIGDITRNEIVPVNPFCDATVIVAVPEVPLLKLRVETSGVTLMSWNGVTKKIMVLE
jgi:hypothetical protein